MVKIGKIVPVSDHKDAPNHVFDADQVRTLDYKPKDRLLPRFALEDASYLEEVGLLAPAESGFRKVCTARMHSVRSVKSSHMSARRRSYAHSGYVSMTSSSLRFTDVPNMYTLKARLQLVGFNEKTFFTMLFEHWQDQLPDDRTDFPMLHIFT